LDHGAQQAALVVDDGVPPLNPVDGALVQRKAPEGVHGVPPDDKGRDEAHLGVVLLDAGQVAERLVFRLELVVVGQLAAQLGVFSPQGLVFRHGLVDAGVLVPDRGHPPGHPGGRFLERGRRHAQQLLGGCGQAAVGRGIQQQPCKKDRHRDQDPEFPGLKKVFHGRSPPLDEKAPGRKSADSRSHPRFCSQVMPAALGYAPQARFYMWSPSVSSTSCSTSTWSSTAPAPVATQSRGSSATWTSMPVSLWISLSRPRSRAPPPVRVMPRSMMSALSSGGVRSSVSLMASVILTRHSSKASRTSSEWTTMFLGRPSTRLRPLISMVISSSSL